MTRAILPPMTESGERCLPVGAGVATYVVAWAAVAAGLGASGWIAAPPPPVVGATIAATVAMTLALAATPAGRRSLAATGDRPLVLVHVVRFFGLLFLANAGMRFPAAWAIPAGWADLLVAAAAVPVALYAVPAVTRRQRVALWAFTLAGLVDIVAAPGSAVYHAITRPGSMDAMGTFPLTLVWTVFVPLTLSAHLLMLGRLLSRKGGAA
jgi:hypothetical protein